MGRFYELKCLRLWCCALCHIYVTSDKTYTVAVGPLEMCVQIVLFVVCVCTPLLIVTTWSTQLPFRDRSRTTRSPHLHQPPQKPQRYKLPSPINLPYTKLYHTFQNFKKKQQIPPALLTRTKRGLPVSFSLICLVSICIGQTYVSFSHSVLSSNCS